MHSMHSTHCETHKLSWLSSTLVAGKQWEAMGVSPGHQASANFESGALLEDCMLADTGGAVLAADLRM